jgi:3-deoxy-7-phosphoheptulonate synthase
MWTIDSWKKKPDAQPAGYEDEAELASVVRKLRSLPPLVTSWETERLKSHLAEAQSGRRFVLQGGDCAETLDGCQPDVITRLLKILLQMSLVLMHGGRRPVVRIGRFAGQYAKPRSSPLETRGDVTLPSYRGDLVNRSAFTREARRPDPKLLLEGYAHAAMTLNFVRALTEGGFADLHHPEYWDLSFLERADLPHELREEYERTSTKLAEALRFMEALGETSIDELSRVEIYTSHEGLNLHYESAQTRVVPRRAGYYCLTTHLPWIGERTRDLGGAHVEFFRGIRNPIGIKLGPKATGEETAALLDALDPEREPGKIVLVTRLGADDVERVLPGLVSAVKRADRKVLWMTDPMHGNTFTSREGVKTRDVERILLEVERTFDVLESCGARLGGVHLELTGEDVTECVGGGLSEGDLDRNYASVCDPRLNYRQAMEMAFAIARRLGRWAPGSIRP